MKGKETRILRKLNGWLKLSKKRHILARNSKLTDKEYRVWDLMLSLRGFDERNQDSYMVVEVTDREIASLLNCSISQACRARQKLMQKGWIEQIDRSRYSIIVDVVVHKGNVAPVQVDIVPVQESIAPTQTQSEEDWSPSIFSSKVGNINSYPRILKAKEVVIHGLRSDEEYQKLARDHDLMIDDMKWIDQYPFRTNLDDEPYKESDLVEIFFNGDWDLYKRNNSNYDDN